MDDSPLNTLPAELRNEVYDLALSDETTDGFPIQITKPESALTRACRQIRQETLAIYYGRPNGFHTPIAPADTSSRLVFQKWISTRGRNSNGERLRWVQLLCVSNKFNIRSIPRGWSGPFSPVEDEHAPASQILMETGFTMNKMWRRLCPDLEGHDMCVCLFYRTQIPDGARRLAAVDYLSKLQSACSRSEGLGYLCW